MFSALGREVLKQPNHLEASKASRAMGGPGVSIQSWCLAPKLREADIAMLPSAQLVVREVHPEVSFWAMNDRVPMPFRKKFGMAHVSAREHWFEQASHQNSLRIWDRTSVLAATTSSTPVPHCGLHAESRLAQPSAFRSRQTSIAVAWTKLFGSKNRIATYISAAVRRSRRSPSISRAVEKSAEKPTLLSHNC